MSIESPAVLLVQNDVASGREDSFDAWYLADHMPDRVATPGFRRARRWRAIEGGPRDLSLYELDGLDTLTSPAYCARLADPTPGTRQHMDAFIGMIRSACRVEHAAGFADGGFAVLLPFAAVPPTLPFAAVPPTLPFAAVPPTLPFAAVPPTLLAAPGWQPDPGTGIVACAILRADLGTSLTDTVESRLRTVPDRHIPAAAWIEAASAAQAAAALHLARAACSAAGLATGAAVLLRLVAAFQQPPR